MITLAMFVLALVIYLPLNSYIPITDPVEANYALTAKEMLLSWDWLSPQIYGKYWFDKPAMIYWLIAACFKVFGIGEFAARFPAAVFSAGSVAFTYWYGKKLFDSQRIGLLAALVLATSLEYWFLARMVITDSVLFFFNSLALGFLYLGVIKQRKAWKAAAYFCAALAVLTKGPIGILLPGLIVFVYIIITRRWDFLRELFIIPGLVIFFAVTLPWYIAMYKAHGQEFVSTFLGLHNYLRATVSEHPKDNVFYYYLVLFPVSLLPWTGVFFRSLFGRKPFHFAFFAVWTAVTIVFYTLMATKYPTYVFPALFPAALLAACRLDKMQYPQPRQWLWLTLPVLLLLAVFCAGAKYLPGVNLLWLYLPAAVSAVALIWLQARGERIILPWATGAIIVVMSMLLTYQGMIPLAEKRSAKSIVGSLPPQGAVVAYYGDYSTSAVFYSGYLIPKLVTEKPVESQNVWAGKHTMPVETVVDFAARTKTGSDVYLLVDRKSQPPLEGFGRLAAAGDLVLYKKDFKP